MTFTRHSRKNDKGFTLVETILYAALFVIIMGAIINSVILLSSSYRHIKSLKNVQASALSAMDRMTREIRAAESVEGSGTSYDSSDGSLLLDTGVRFYISSGKILEEKNGQYFGPLTVDGAVVGSLNFRQIDTGNSSGVKIEMTINGKNFYTTTMLRGSY